MKRFNTLGVRTALLACVAAGALAGLYYAGSPHLDSHIRHLLQTGAAKWGGRWNFHADHADGPRDRGASLRCNLACPLPDGWQADWKGGRLWITHRNPNGSVADSLLFDSLRNLYAWIETHPDCCDVDVEKLEHGVSEATVCAPTTAPDTVCPAPDTSDTSSASPVAME